MLRELFASKSLIAALIGCGLVIVGIHFWSQHEHSKIRHEEAETRRFIQQVAAEKKAATTRVEELSVVSQPHEVKRGAQAAHDNFAGDTDDGTPEVVTATKAIEDGALVEEELVAHEEPPERWRIEPHQDNHKHARKSDPWRNNDAATQESLPPEAMSDEELGEQTLNQLIERFGDIPEVHAYMEYDRRVRTRQEIPLEEDIAYLEAMQFLFPNEATRKTIVLKKWELKNGFILPTAADLEYFKSEGITVLYHKDGSLKKITTKY